MGKECCDMKVTETEDRINIAIKGKGIKEKCKVMVEKCCCDEESVKKIIKTCCESMTDDEDCCKEEK